MDESSSQSYVWNLRVRWMADMVAAVYARNNNFTVGHPASFKDKDPYPSAVEYMLGAVGGDLTNGFHAIAAQHGVQIDDVEMALRGRLANPLTYVGVIGEEEEPRLGEISGTLYVSADVGEEIVQEILQTTLDRSPLANTLKHAVTISIEVRLVD